ncbi:DsbA family protein [Pseudohalocynthiibacter aestuariivivens]|uniref:DsbA family protein n=1 Tax=Roseovarius pelagicus TaxID=2980108 RepID=A0ABY6DB01_9RHOB|nr:MULTISPECIES: DsbA family protein [Rhodobacterales]QIE44773.1 DsbA family protein [Pseudohalocynthiibacter aestuariivivens]UXX83316.1 DsbA family protein [Roseovarius pelagicus]
MIRTLLTTAALGATLAAPANALDLSEMSDADRTAFRAEVRAYLMDNPEVIYEAVAVLQEREAAMQAANDGDLLADNADALFADGHSWIGGNPDGDITIVEFMDYRCGYCRKAFPEVEELLAADGNIRLIVKEFPILGEASVVSSRFAIATLQVAGDDAYKQVHEALIDFKGDASEVALGRLASSLGLDAAPILAHMGSDEVTAVIDANRALASKLDISGTPSFVMGSQMIRGYVPLEGMLEIVAEERS